MSYYNIKYYIVLSLESLVFAIFYFFFGKCAVRERASRSVWLDRRQETEQIDETESRCH